MSIARMWLVVAIAVAIALPGCARREQARIFAAEAPQEWETALANGDVEALAALYTEDAQLMPPNAPIVDGRSAIKSFYRNLLEAGPVQLKVDERETIVFGNLTYRSGVYEAKQKDGSVEYGKVMEMWKNEHGNWKLHRAMWSSSEESNVVSTRGAS